MIRNFSLCVLLCVSMSASAFAQAKVETLLTETKEFSSCTRIAEITASNLGLSKRRIIVIVNTGILHMTKIVADDANIIVTCSKADQKLVITRSSPPDLHLIR